MKNLSGTHLKHWLVATALMSIVACAAIVQNKNEGVTFAEKYVIFRPKAKISTADCENINQILKKYDTSLYKIQAYKSGKLIKSRGQLDENHIQNGIVSEVTNEAKSIAFTGCALMAGDSSTKQPIPTQRKEMLKSLKVILEKYNKR